MARCNLCKTTSAFTSKELGVCLDCIRKRPEDALVYAMKAHQKSRIAFGLPEKPPQDPQGISCNLCVNQCMIPEGEMGYCGLRRNESGKIKGVSSEEGKLSWYHDPLPTNCVGDWVCPGSTDAGYPDYSYCPGPETGYRNLAVFFRACSFNCLYCQNWHFKQETFYPSTTSPDALVSDIDKRTACICYFGGDATPQLPFSLKVSELSMEKRKGEILRVCWETNGSMDSRLLDRMMDIAIGTGGCIKFDLKAYDENLHRALTGVTNRRTYENFVKAGERIGQRPDPPPLIASTLLVPGYIDEEEIGRIAAFIASVNPDIPYRMLAFYPHFYMDDIPMTSKDLGQRCLETARKAGLKRVSIGNIHLLA